MNVFLRLLDQGLNGETSYIRVPLRPCMGFGLLVACLSFLHASVVNLTHPCPPTTFFLWPTAERRKLCALSLRLAG